MVINKRKSGNTAKKRNLIAYSHSDSKISEQYRTIRTNLHFSTGDRKDKILLITSPGKGEGKSTTAANLAVSMALQKEKVLLIDANLREPAIHSFFKIPNSAGLTDILTGKITFEEAAHRTEIGRLKVITSGPVPNNPIELLGSHIMKEMLKKILPLYDAVLIDSPSVLEVADTKILANLCDGVVLVLLKGKTGLEKASEAKKVLEFAKANFTGVIMNKI